MKIQHTAAQTGRNSSMIIYFGFALLGVIPSAHSYDISFNGFVKRRRWQFSEEAEHIF